MTDAEKEYRAQWIRDAARDLLVAHLSVGAEQSVYRDTEYPPHVGIWSVAVVLWDMYVKERE